MPEPRSPADGEALGRVQRRAHDFDVPALLDRLASLGFQGADVELRSRRSTVCQGRVVHAVGLDPAAHRVTVDVNLGLLAASSPLPSYFLQAIDELDSDDLTSDERLELVRLLDHHLLRERFASLYPERDAGLSGGEGWEETKALLASQLGLASPSSLHWLFASVFPELTVLVRRGRAGRQVPSEAVRLGQSRLGSGSFGGRAEVGTGTIEVTLGGGDTPAASGLTWPAEARRRLEDQVLPVLGDRAAQVTVWLALDEPVEPFQLAAVSSLGAGELGRPDGLDRSAVLLLAPPLLCQDPPRV
jgi:hypothetical protein